MIDHRLIVALLAAAMACPANAVDRVVTVTGDNGDGSCDASCTLRDALEASAEDDRVLLDPSLPRPVVLEITGPQIAIAVPMRIIGIDGVPALVRRTGGSGRLLDLQPGADVRIVGFGFEDGLVSGSGASGGAIRVQSGAVLELRDCVFRNNQVMSPGGAPGLSAGAPAAGGAIHATGDLLLENCAFVANAARGGAGSNAFAPGGDGGDGASARGGAIFVSGTLELLNTTFHDNLAEGGDGGNGAINVVDSGLANGNGGDAGGGALWVDSGNSASLGFATLVANSVAPGTGGGGASGGNNPPGFAGLNGAALGAAIGSDGDVLLNASVLAANLGASACDGAGNFSLRTDNLVDDAACPGALTAGLPATFFAIDPMADSPHYAPREGSPAVDTAPDCLDAVGAEAVDLDQLLSPRPIAGDRVTAACDFGAVEFDPVLFGDGFEDPPPEP